MNSITLLQALLQRSEGERDAALGQLRQAELQTIAIRRDQRNTDEAAQRSHSAGRAMATIFT